MQHKTNHNCIDASTYYNTTGISTANSILWQVNPDLNTKYGNTIRSLNNWDNNIKGAAYLCDATHWNSTYVASADITAGAYAIEGVSAEMFCDSYNQARGVTSGASLFDAEAFSKNSTYGYLYKPKSSSSSTYEGNYGSITDMTDYPISSSDYGGMYRLPGSEATRLLSSPLAISTYVCGVYEANGSLKYYSRDLDTYPEPMISNNKTINSDIYERKIGQQRFRIVRH